MLSVPVNSSVTVTAAGAVGVVGAGSLEQAEAEPSQQYPEKQWRM
jgi:hypothetical protein